MTRREICNSMTLQDAIQVFRDTNAYGTMDIAKTVILEALEQKTAHWIYTKAVNTGEIIWSECSECGNGEKGCAKRMKYCPECGARMKGEGEFQK